MKDRIVMYTEWTPTGSGLVRISKNTGELGPLENSVHQGNSDHGRTLFSNIFFKWVVKYRIETEGKVTTANSTRGRQPKGSVCRSRCPVVSI